MPRAATSPLACSRVTIVPSAPEPHEPLALAVGAVQVDRLAGAGQGIGAASRVGMMSKASWIPSTASSALDRLRSAARRLRVPSVHRDLVRPWRRAQNPALLIGRPRPHLSSGATDASVSASPAAPRRTSRSRRPEPVGRPCASSSDGGAGASPRCASPSAGCARCARADPTPPFRTRRDLRIDARRRLRQSRCVALGADRGDVLARAPSVATLLRRFDQFRAVVVGLVHERRDGPHLELVGGRGYEQPPATCRRPGTRVEPAVPLRFRDHDRHALVDRLHQVVGLGRDDRERPQAWRVVADLRVVPDLPQPRERERLAVATADEPRLLLLFVRASPTRRTRRPGRSPRRLRMPACTPASSRPIRPGR